MTARLRVRRTAVRAAPGGAQVYDAGSEEIVTFRRDTQIGRLTPVRATEGIVDETFQDLRFDRSGRRIYASTMPRCMPQTEPGSLHGFARDVASGRLDRVASYQTGRGGFDGFYAPQGIAVKPSHGEILVADLGGSPTTLTVPEPSSTLALVVATAALAQIRRRVECS